VWQAIEDILVTSKEIREAVGKGELKVVGALYDIETGVVTFMGMHYRQEQLVRGTEIED
jgi:carbonic anhydrase